MKRISRLNLRTTFLILLAAIGSIACYTSTARAQAAESPGDSPAEKYGVWNCIEDPSGNRVHRMRIRVHPQAAPMPAFKYRLVPDPNDRVDGNSALFYLKALGFFEQRSSRKALFKLEQKWRDQASKEGQDSNYWPPNTWGDMAPESLPMDQVREYLKLHAFQPEFLYDAARRTRFEHDRAIERETNPIGYLLPSLQEHRELARVQNVRCRFAIAEGRIDDAIEIIGQLMTMGRHLGTDEFLVTCLIGASVHGIGVETGLVLSQQPDAPNLYWAIAACPDPAIDLNRAIATERKLLYLQMPILKEVTETVRPPSFWSDFLKRFIEPINQVSEETMGSGSASGPGPQIPQDLFGAANVVAADYPTARQFLKEVAGIPDKQLDAYPKAQVVFLALVKYYDFANDEMLKQVVVPFAYRPQESKVFKLWQSKFNPGPLDMDSSFLFFGDILVPPIESVLNAATRVEQWQNLWQTVEALRLTAAENGGKLPDSLDQLSVPAPLDPATNQPFEYELNEGVATFRGAKIRNHDQYEIELELLQRSEQQEKTK